jgi:hypothetical protein
MYPCTYDKNLEMIQPLVQELYQFSTLAPWWPSQESDRTEIWSVSCSFLGSIALVQRWLKKATDHTILSLVIIMAMVDIRNRATNKKTAKLCGHNNITGDFNTFLHKMILQIY